MGYGGQQITPELTKRIDQAMQRCDEIARSAAVIRAFAADALPIDLPGQDVAAHLRGAREVAFFAVTLGHAVDRELRRLSVADPLGQLVFDAAATEAVERLADKTEARIRADAAERGLYCGRRFSPGYGDLPLDVQRSFLAVLDVARRLGITLTPSSLMVPTKSVTALVGVHATPQPAPASSCSVCSLSEFCTARMCRLV